MAADGTITILAARILFFRPCRELMSQHTPESFRRRSRLGENKCRNANLCASFRRHFAAAKLQTVNSGRIGKLGCDG
jgi:hypothetical protein